MSNVGHGWVVPRTDGIKARCGGPGVCLQCSRDEVKLHQDSARVALEAVNIELRERERIIEFQRREIQRLQAELEIARSRL